MKAVVYDGPRRMRVADEPEPKLKGPKDAVLRVTTSAICGSDLHMFEGRTPLKPGQVVGHEIMGVIEEVGEAVSSIKEGDRVVLDLSAEQAKQRWRDENRERALFEREDQGEMGPRSLDRSFEGTYR